MRVKFQYADWTEWEGPPERAHESPDPRPPYEGVVWTPSMKGGGVIRMWAMDDFDRRIEFVYDDLYYLYPVEGGWLFGSGVPKRDYILRPGQDGSETQVLPIELPKDAVVRYGVTIPQEEARRFGLVPVKVEPLSPKRSVTVKRCCD